MYHATLKNMNDFDKMKTGKCMQIAMLLGSLLFALPMSLMAEADTPHWAYEGEGGAEH